MQERVACRVGSHGLQSRRTVVDQTKDGRRFVKPRDSDVGYEVENEAIARNEVVMANVLVR